MPTKRITYISIALLLFSIVVVSGASAQDGLPGSGWFTTFTLQNPGSSGTATFTADLDDNVGIGDMIVYSGDTIIVNIVGRTDAQTFAVENIDGSLPADVAGNADWSIYRPYNYILSALNGNENNSIPAGIRDFDGSGLSDLTGANIQLNLPLYIDAHDTGTNTLQSMNTSAANHVHLFTPYLPTQVGASQRHNGVWDDAKSTLSDTAAGPVVWRLRATAASAHGHWHATPRLWSRHFPV